MSHPAPDTIRFYSFLQVRLAATAAATAVAWVVAEELAAAGSSNEDYCANAMPRSTRATGQNVSK